MVRTLILSAIFLDGNQLTISLGLNRTAVALRPFRHS